MLLLPHGALQKRKLKCIYSPCRGGRAVPRAGLLQPWGRQWQGKGGAGQAAPGRTGEQAAAPRGAAGGGREGRGQ